MIGSLEYLMASLPNLNFEAAEADRDRVFHVLTKYTGATEADQDPTAMLEQEAEKFLSPSVAVQFKDIALARMHQKQAGESSHPVLEEYAAFMRSLKLEVKRLREARRNAGTSRQPKDLIMPIQPADALEEELLLLKMQWDKLEELSFGSYADVGALILYKLKLEVLARRWAFDQEKGLATFMSITQTTEYGG